MSYSFSLSVFIIASLLFAAYAFVPRNMGSYHTSRNIAKMMGSMGSCNPSSWNCKPSGIPRSSFQVRTRNPFQYIADPNRVMKEFIDSWESAGSAVVESIALALDVKESESHYDLYIDAPGVDKDATKIEIKDHILTIVTERKALEVTEKEKLNRTERLAGTSSRSLRLAEDADEDNVEASYTNGVLQIRIPKKVIVDPTKKVKNITIQ